MLSYVAFTHLCAIHLPTGTQGLSLLFGPGRPRALWGGQRLCGVMVCAWVLRLNLAPLSTNCGALGESLSSSAQWRQGSFPRCLLWSPRPLSPLRAAYSCPRLSSMPRGHEGLILGFLGEAGIPSATSALQLLCMRSLPRTGFTQMGSSSARVQVIVLKI